MRIALASVVFVSAASFAAAPPDDARPATKTSSGARSAYDRFDPALVRALSVDLAADPATGPPGNGPAQHDGGAFLPRDQAKIDRAFADATKPSCMTGDAFRLDPTKLGPITIIAPNTWEGRGAIDLRALFLAKTILTGRCRD